MTPYLIIYFVSLIGLALFVWYIYSQWDFDYDGPITRQHVVYAILVVLTPAVNTIVAMMILFFWSISTFDKWIESKPFKRVTDWLEQPVKRSR